jgi:hypothetical protein
VTASELSQEIRTHVDKARSALFVGSGVGCRVNLPSWPEWLEQLVRICVEFKDLKAAELIRSRIESRDFLGAAHTGDALACKDASINPNLPAMK